MYTNKTYNEQLKLTNIVQLNFTVLTNETRENPRVLRGEIADKIASFRSQFSQNTLKFTFLSMQEIHNTR